MRSSAGNRQGVAGLGGFVGGGRRVGEGIGGLAVTPGTDGEDDNEEHDERAHNRGGDAPVELGKLERDEVQRAARMFGERGRFAEFLGAAEFLIERGHEAGNVELEQAGVGADKSADVNGGGKRVEIAFFERADMVAANLVTSAT